jgi:RNA polymerase sigma-70 factor, ECF subfamily
VSVAAVTSEDLSIIAARCARGERAAQRELFTRTRAVVHRTLFRILGSNRDVEDLLQETYLIVFRSIDRFEGRSSASTWCCGIAVNVAYNHLRSARRRKHEPEVDVVDPDADPGRQVVEREAAHRLYVALDHLEPEQRVAFTLSVIDGQPVADVAVLLGVSGGAVKTRVWRARKHLEKLARKDPALAGYVSRLGAPGEEP